MSLYNPNVPTGLIKLKIDYKNVQNNFVQINDTYGIDHVPLTDNSGTFPSGLNGAHKIVHLVPQSGTPTAYTSVGELYSKSINSIQTDIALFYQTGAGREIQMTMNVVPSPTYNGYSFLPGGLLYQWGFTLVSTSTSSVQSFPIAFPNATISIVATLFYSGSVPSGRATVCIKTDHTSATSKTQFNWTTFLDGNSGYTGFQWFAIGN